MTPEELEERIRDAMTGDGTAPRSALWGRIAERRVAGDRVALPLGRKQHLTRVLIISGMAAATLLALSPLFERHGPDQPVGPPLPAAAFPKEDHSLFFPGALMAQASATPAFTAGTLSGADRRPGKWTHGRYDKGELKETYSFELRSSNYEGAAAWLLISTMTRVGRSWNLNDTTWASIDSMQPLLRIVHTGDARIEQTYRREDILTGVTRNGYTSWSTTLQRDPSLPFGGGILFRPSEISMRLMAMDLHEGWQGSIPLPASGEQGLASLWLNLAVDGSETLKVPAGTFETWRIRTLFGKKPLEPYDPARPPSGLYFWVSKDDRWLVQMSIVGRDREPDATPLVLIKGEQE